MRELGFDFVATADCGKVVGAQHSSAPPWLDYFCSAGLSRTYVFLHFANRQRIKNRLVETDSVLADHFCNQRSRGYCQADNENPYARTRIQPVLVPIPLRSVEWTYRSVWSMLAHTKRILRILEVLRRDRRVDNPGRVSRDLREQPRR